MSAPLFLVIFISGFGLPCLRGQRTRAGSTWLEGEGRGRSRDFTATDDAITRSRAHPIRGHTASYPCPTRQPSQPNNRARATAHTWALPPRRRSDEQVTSTETRPGSSASPHTHSWVRHSRRDGGRGPPAPSSLPRAPPSGTLPGPDAPTLTRTYSPPLLPPQPQARLRFRSPRSEQFPHRHPAPHPALIPSWDAHDSPLGEQRSTGCRKGAQRLRLARDGAGRKPEPEETAREAPPSVLLPRSYLRGFWEMWSGVWESAQLTLRRLTSPAGNATRS